MIAVDANLLIYAYTGSIEFHSGAKRWLEKVLHDSDPVGLPWSSIHAFLRIMTQRLLFEIPLSMAQAAAAVEQWLGRPNVVVINPGPRYWPVLNRLIHGAQIRGNLVMDAHLAALTIENAGTLCTTDKDFSRFDDLRVINPLEASA